ncbi:MAG: class I tRNA ligase family protein, partial [Patescibacteria group bacterium]
MTLTNKYNHTLTEKKWQDKWRETKLYHPDVSDASDKYYNLWMFPYPSAEGVHVGTIFSSTGGDVHGRFMRMQGKRVLQPMGYDSFGIHSENYALKIGEAPQVFVDRAIKNYERQFKQIGHGYDWDRAVATSEADYYKWTQWLFVQLFKAGLAYKKKAFVNWCPGCKTVLSDEQIVTPAQAGKFPPTYTSIEEVPEGTRVCERCGNIPKRRQLSQWFFRITDYADRLLGNLDKIDWTQKVKVAQKEWIGKAKGRLITFKKENGEELEVFTTRPDTLNSATFLVVADDELYNKHKQTYEKEGVATGEYAINSLNGRRLPIWKASYVAPGYGTGTVMGVPAYDERDYQFATKYHLDIVKEPLKDNGLGKEHVNYHLRDWLVSRQRYWGAPIPMIYCDVCAKKGNSYFDLQGETLQADHSDWEPAGWYPEENLPVVLPEIADYKPSGEGKGPLADHPEFYNVKCPHCGSDAIRETDVLDTFVDSSWYFLRYPSVDAVSANLMPFDKQITQDWLPVDLYFGGAEHSVLHLMYARFVTQALYDLKLGSFE